MRILLLTYGSRGDVQPFLTLAVVLQKRGHDVNLAAPHRFEEWVSSYGVPFIPLSGDPDIFSQQLNEAGRNPFRMVNTMMTYVLSVADQVILEIIQACEGKDIIIHSYLFTTGAHSIAKKMNIPDISLQTFPIFAPTKDIAPVFLPNVRNGLLRYFITWLAKQVFWYAGNMGYHKIARKHPELPFIKLHWPFAKEDDFQKSPLIFAFSPHVIPRPMEWNKNHIHISGYLFLGSRTEACSDALQEFLDMGDAPICISFGSMVHRSLPGIIQAILQAGRELDMRVVLLSGWEIYNPLDSDPNIFIAKEAPHEKLFPECSMIIHHGGAGTTAAALRAGVPNLVIPFGADQMFWGLKVYELGAGPAPIPDNNVSVKKFVEAIEYAGRADIKKQAMRIADDLVNENGIAQVIQIIESKLTK